MNFSEDTSLGKHTSHCSLDIDEWIILDFIFNVCDGHTCSTDSVARPCPESKLSLIREHFKVNCCVCFLKMSPRLLIIFLKHLICMLLSHVIYLFLCFFLPRLGENPASAHFQGNPTKCTWKFFFCLVELKIILFFPISGIFGFFPRNVLYFQTEGVSIKQPLNDEP